MNKVENFTIRVDAELKRRLQAHPEINWSHVIREHVRSVLEDIERMDRLAGDSQLTEMEVEELAAMIDAAAAERMREDMAAERPARGSSTGAIDANDSTASGGVTDTDAS